MAEYPTIPRLRIMKKLGSGGAADVYLAVQEPLNREVAVKILIPALFRDENLPKRFLKEAETAAGLRQQNIVIIYDVGQAGETYYIVMEYLQENLRERIQRGAMAPDAALGVLRQVAEALGYAHARGFIHRDVKPENIMFRDDGTAVLADFGIVKAIGTETKLTATEMSIGTPHYMSPEQGRGEKIDGRSDMYSLGVVLYEMLTGRVPYDAENTVGVVIKHIQEPIPKLPPHLARFQPLIDRLLAKARNERVGSTEDLGRLLAEIEGSHNLGQSASPVSPTARAGERDDREMPRDALSAEPGWKIKKTPEPAIQDNANKKIERRERSGLADYNRDAEAHWVKAKSGRPWIIPVLVVILAVVVTALIGVLSIGDAERANTPKAVKTWKELLPGMEFVWIPRGEFMMGSNSGSSNEKPVHRVRITKGFWMGKYEVTQGQWKAIMGSNPSHFKKGDNYPVESVSWNDVQEFIRRLNSRTGQRFRLPSEAEWEYACRAGTTGDRYGNLNDIAWYSLNSGRSTQPVGQKQPNAFGLYDMLGNVLEWVQDWYESGYYSRSSVDDPQGPLSGSSRVNRGGSWFYVAQDVRAAHRFIGSPSGRDYYFGFRLARTE